MTHPGTGQAWGFLQGPEMSGPRGLSPGRQGSEPKHRHLAWSGQCEPQTWPVILFPPGTFLLHRCSSGASLSCSASLHAALRTGPAPWERLLCPPFWGALPGRLRSLHRMQSLLLPGKGLPAPGHQEKGWAMEWGEHILQKGPEARCLPQVPRDGKVTEEGA